MWLRGRRDRGSISRNLTISIVVTAVLVILVGTAAFTTYIVKKEKADLLQASDEAVELAAQSLSLPLWYLHADSITEIAHAYAVNPLIVGLRIHDMSGKQLFSYSAPGVTGKDIRRQSAITHKGQTIGQLEMVVSVNPLESNLYQLLVLGGLACLLVSVALLILTGFWLRIFLNRPVQRLEALVENYSGGELPPLAEAALPNEFAGLEETLRSMASRIHKQVEELALAESRYRSLFQNALEGMFRSSVDGRLVTANPAMASMLGYDSSEELLEAVQDLNIDLYARPSARDAVIQQLNSHGKIENHETVFRKKNGDFLMVNLGALVVYEEENLIQGHCQDITRQIEVREALIAAKEAAETANQLKTDFISMVSHELRTPLTSVVGFSKLIGKRLRKDVFSRPGRQEDVLSENIQQIQQQLSIIIKEGERLTRLINNVLDLAKLEAGRLSLEITQCEIPGLVERALETSQALLAEKGLSGAMEVAPGLPSVACDHDRILQVLINLISNSVRFTPQGDIVCKVELLDGRILVSVEDQGPGIDPAQAKHVFEKFYQLSDTVQNPQSSTGLGLAICKELIERHGGEIWYENLEPKGCAFRFTLPLSPQ